jgi:hypothetical protein
MRKWIALIAVIAVVFFLGLAVGNRTGVRWTDIIPVGDVPVKARPSFAQDILPIFQGECTLCHGPDDAHNGLRLDSYDGVMKGTNFGAVVEPGNPDLSNLISVVKRETSPKIWMPFHRGKLSPNKISNIENWISIGAPNN